MDHLSGTQCTYLRVGVGLEVALSAGGPLKAVENRVGVAGLLVAAQPRVAYGVPELVALHKLPYSAVRNSANSVRRTRGEAVETFPAHRASETYFSDMTCTCCTSITLQTCQKGKDSVARVRGGEFTQPNLDLFGHVCTYLVHPLSSPRKGLWYLISYRNPSLPLNIIIDIYIPRFL